MRRSCSELLRVENSLEKANIYAKNGIWYEALDLASEEKNLASHQNYVQFLLENVQIKSIFSQSN